MNIIFATVMQLTPGATNEASTQTLFFTNGIGLLIQRLAAVIAMLVVVVGLFQTGKAVVSGRGGSAVKSVIGTIVLAALLFNLQLIIIFVNWAIKIVEQLMTTVGGAF